MVQTQLESIKCTPAGIPSPAPHQLPPGGYVSLTHTTSASRHWGRTSHIHLLHPLVHNSRLHRLSRHGTTQHCRARKSNTRMTWNHNSFAEFSNATSGILGFFDSKHPCSFSFPNFSGRPQCRKLRHFTILGLYFDIGCIGSHSHSAADPF